MTLRPSMQNDGCQMQEARCEKIAHGGRLVTRRLTPPPLRRRRRGWRRRTLWTEELLKETTPIDRWVDGLCTRSDPAARVGFCANIRFRVHLLSLLAVFLLRGWLGM